MLLSTVIGCAGVAWAIAWMASRRHIGGMFVVLVFASVVTLNMQRQALGYFVLAVPMWVLQLMLAWNFITLAGYAYYVWTTCVEPVKFAGVFAAWNRTFADSRRRSSVRAAVRRTVKQYSVEVG